jgi:hypothetical protein
MDGGLTKMPIKLYKKQWSRGLERYIETQIGYEKNNNCRFEITSSDRIVDNTLTIYFDRYTISLERRIVHDIVASVMASSPPSLQAHMKSYLEGLIEDQKGGGKP